MMHFSLLLILIFICATAIPSQDQPLTESQRLNQQIVAFYQKGDFDNAIPLAEKLVDLQRSQNPQSIGGLTNALENLATLKLARFKREAEKYGTTALSQADISKRFRNLHQDARGAESNFKEALKLCEKLANFPSAQSISLRSNLAWLLYNYLASDETMPIGLDKKTKEEFDILNRGRLDRRLNEAEETFKKALEEGESFYGPTDENTLLAIFRLAEFYLSTTRLEDAEGLYQKCLTLVESKYGAQSNNLLLPLESYAKLLFATGQKYEYTIIQERIARITGKNPPKSSTLINLSLRSENSSTIATSPMIEMLSNSNADIEYLRRRSQTINLGSGGNASIQTMRISSNVQSIFNLPPRSQVIPVVTMVTIDGNGKVLETRALADDKRVKELVEKAVKHWKFKPYILDGKSTGLVGYVECLLMIADFSAK